MLQGATMSIMFVDGAVAPSTNIMDMILPYGPGFALWNKLLDLTSEFTASTSTAGPSSRSTRPRRDGRPVRVTRPKRDDRPARGDEIRENRTARGGVKKKNAIARFFQRGDVKKAEHPASDHHISYLVRERLEREWKRDAQKYGTTSVG